MKTIGITQLKQKRFTTLDFTGEWLESLGTPECNFTAIIYGDSGNGKTDFSVKFAKYLSTFGKVLYLSHEEGISSTIQEAFNRNAMHEVNGKVVVGEKGTIHDLVAYLKKRNSPQYVFIDSLDYMNLTHEQYKQLRATFPRKSFVIISWSDGKKPKSKHGEKIEYMCDIKLLVRQYVAYPRSRYGGNAPYIIWHEKAGLVTPVVRKMPTKDAKNNTVAGGLDALFATQ